MKKVFLAVLVLGISGFCLSSCEVLRTDEMMSTTGQVCFDVQPAAAEVYIDGEYAGQAKGCMTLERGRHHIKIDKKNFHSYERDIYVGRATQNITVKLPPEKGKSGAPPGQMKKAVPPGQTKKTVPPGQLNKAPSAVPVKVGPASRDEEKEKEKKEKQVKKEIEDRVKKEADKQYQEKQDPKKEKEEESKVKGKSGSSKAKGGKDKDEEEDKDKEKKEK